MIKKILALALSATCILGVFAGCDSDNKKADIEIKTKEDAQTVANDVLKKAQNGDDFDTLMNKYSSDPGLATNPLGYVVAQGQMVPEFETASYALKVDEISDVVPTDYGFHIIKRYTFDEEFFEANKSNLSTLYNSYTSDAEFKKVLDSIKPVYEEGYEDLTVTNIDDYTAETVFKVGDISISTALFRYFLLSLAQQQDQGDKTFWDTNAEAAKTVKTNAEDNCKQFLAIKIFAANNKIELSDDDNTEIQAQIDSAITEEGGQEKYEAALTTAFLDETTFKQIVLIQSLQKKVYTALCGDTVADSIPIDDVLAFLNDLDKSGIVRVKHILISLPKEEEETTTSAADTTLNEDTISQEETTTPAPEETTTLAQ